MRALSKVYLCFNKIFTIIWKYAQVSSHIYNVTGETSREEMKGTYIKHTIMFIERDLNSRLDQYLIRIQRAGLK